MYRLSKKSLSTLEGVHPDLVKVVKRAIQLTSQDFSVNMGVRTAAEQNALYQKGRTKPGKIVTYRDGYKKKSNHQAKADGYGHSVDLVPYPYGGDDDGDGVKNGWDHDEYYAIRDAMFQAAKELGVSLVWGGNWEMRDYPHFEVAHA